MTFIAMLVLVISGRFKSGMSSTLPIVVKQHEYADQEGCSSTPPKILTILKDADEPEEPTGIKPRIALYAPCLFKSFEKVVRKYQPSGTWYHKTDHNGARLELKHRHEPPIFLNSDIRTNDTIATFLSSNILPMFGELTIESYDWYFSQESTLVIAIQDPSIEESNVFEQAYIRPLMMQVATRYPRQQADPSKGFVLLAWINAKDPSNLKWIRSEFGITQFPAIVVQKELGLVFKYKGEVSLTPLIQFITDVKEGCVEWRSHKEAWTGRERHIVFRPPDVCSSIDEHIDQEAALQALDTVHES